MAIKVKRDDDKFDCKIIWEDMDILRLKLQIC